MSKVKRLKSQFSRRAFAPPPPHPPFAGCGGRKSAARGEGGRSPLGGPGCGPARTARTSRRAPNRSEA